MAFSKCFSHEPTGLNDLQPKPAGSGNQGKCWTAVARRSDSGVTWLASAELRELEALGDTLLPGFEAGDDATVEQTVAMLRSNIFQGKMVNRLRPGQDPLPQNVEEYTRVLARRILDMQGRAGSDVGIAVLVAQAIENNISKEQRGGLRLLFRVLSTRVGALILTGRAVPFHEQSLAARHALLKRWSVSRVGKLREAFQGVKRLSCSLYFSAHPDVPLDGLMRTAAATAKIQTNPNWTDIRYNPQHHRLARDGYPASALPSAGRGSTSNQGLWSGAKVKAPATAPAANTASRSCTPDNAVPAFAVPPSSSTPPDPPTAPRPPRQSRSSGASPVAPVWGGSDAPGTLPREIEVDVVVVGSGAGGGCTAGVLAARGFKVAVLEKGGLYGAADFAGFSEMEAYKKLYEGEGVVASDDGSMVVLAGSCVGGGTQVNWAASFRTPRHVRLEWARKMGLKSFESGGPYDKALDAVCRRLDVNTEHSHRAPGCEAPHASLRVNQHQSSLWHGAVASGRVPKVVPRNAKGCVDCGSCLHGCAFGNKRTTQTTWLQDGFDSGNIILVPNAKVDRVLMDAGKATGVEATVTPRGGGEAVLLTVRARAVVVSGGAIHTPAILLRSGLKHPMIGRHLCLHPVLVVGGIFPEDYAKEEVGEDVGESKHQVLADDVNSESKARVGPELPDLPIRVPGLGRGVMMGVYVQDLMRLDGGYGCVIEAPPVHPGLLGLVLPWNDALTHRLSVAMSRETSVFLCIGRDRSSKDNRIVLGPRGDPVIKYKLGKEDANVILEGRSEMLRMMRKAGASILMPAHEGAPWFCPADGEDSDGLFEEYVEAIKTRGTTTNEAGLFSAHQMGSCRLSTNPEDGPLRETGESWECDGLFVADASVFPTSLGINPMITVEAVAYMIADQVASKLGDENTGATTTASDAAVELIIEGDGKQGERPEGGAPSSTREPLPVSGGQTTAVQIEDDYGVSSADLSW